MTQPPTVAPAVARGEERRDDVLTFQIDGIDDLLRQVDTYSRDIPKAIASGMNRTMRAVEQNQLVAMERHLDRPTPFTLNATHIFNANPNRLQTTLFLKDKQAEYLRPAILGGPVAPGANPGNNIIPVMSNARLNAYGNLAAKRRAGALDRIAGRSGKRFVGKIGRKVGVFERQPNRRLKAIVVLDPHARRDKRLPWLETAERVIGQRWERDIRAELESLLLARNL